MFAAQEPGASALWNGAVASRGCSLLARSPCSCCSWTCSVKGAPRATASTSGPRITILVACSGRGQSTASVAGLVDARGSSPLLPRLSESCPEDSVMWHQAKCRSPADAQGRLG